jgi:hypothetical protein
MGERDVGIVPGDFMRFAPIATVAQRRSVEGTLGCPKYVYKFRTAANPGDTGAARKSFTVRRLKSRRRHAAVSSQLRIPSLTPSQISDHLCFQ